jgi:hypothetical protein
MGPQVRRLEGGGRLVEWQATLPVIRNAILCMSLTHVRIASEHVQARLPTVRNPSVKHAPLFSPGIGPFADVAAFHGFQSPP